MSHGPSARAEKMARMAQAAVGGEPVRDLSPPAREQRTSRHQILKIYAVPDTPLTLPARPFPQLRTVSVNEMPPAVPSDGSKPTGEPAPASDPAPAPASDPTPAPAPTATSTDLGSEVPVKGEANEHPAPGGLRWSRNMPLPRKYQILFDAFVAVQQVFPMMRRRGKGGNTEELCAGVEEATRRRCTVETLRAIEALRPGTLSLSLKPGVRDDDTNAVSDPRRVRVDLPDGTGFRGVGVRQPKPGGSSANDAFRQILVNFVADAHAEFLRRLPDGGGDAFTPEVNSKGVALEWHEGFDLDDPAHVPDPALAAVSRPRVTQPSSTNAQPSSDGDAHKRARTDDATVSLPGVLGTGNASGNGTALRASWLVTGRDGRELDTQDVKLKSAMERAVTAEEAEAERRRMGHVDADTLPISAVAEVMHRRAIAELEEDPATVEQRRQRRLRDMLPELFDCVRSNLSTGKRKRVMPFQELLGLITTHTTRQNTSEEEMEGGLRLLAESAPEWVELKPSQFGEEREELWRVKNVGKEVTQFVREKLEAMKQDRL